MRKKCMRFWNFLLIFWHLVDIHVVDLLDVSLSFSIPKLPSLEEDRWEKYMFGSSRTMRNIIQYYISPMYFSWSMYWINSEVNGYCFPWIFRYFDYARTLKILEKRNCHVQRFRFFQCFLILCMGITLWSWELFGMGCMENKLKYYSVVIL